MCVNNLSKVALDGAAAGIEPATSSRKSNALTTAPLSHTKHDIYYCFINYKRNNRYGYLTLAQMQAWSYYKIIYIITLLHMLKKLHAVCTMMYTPTLENS